MQPNPSKQLFEYCHFLLPHAGQKYILYLTVNTHGLSYKYQRTVMTVVRLFVLDQV